MGHIYTVKIMSGERGRGKYINNQYNQDRVSFTNDAYLLHYKKALRDDNEFYLQPMPIKSKVG